MTAIYKYVRWLFWNAVALVWRPKEFGPYLRLRAECMWPWRKFVPNVWHNDDCREWQIYLADEPTYTRRQAMELEVHVSQETGRIVGFDIWDEHLEPKSENVTQE